MPRRIVRYAIIALFTAIGLTFMGLADQIVMMAFGLILGSAAVATALAFGLGGRDAAARVARAAGRTGSPAARLRRPPRRIRGGQRSRRQPAASGLTDLRRSGRVRADASRHRTWRPATASRRSRSRPTAAPSSSRATSRIRRSAVAIDLDTIEILKETDPDTFWQTPHYDGWEGVLIRYDSPDPERVYATMIERVARLGRGKAQAASAQAQVSRFDSYVAIDWSGAKGTRHKGIAIAEARGDAAPRLVRPGHVWSREEVLELAAQARREGADPVRLRLQLRAADRRARRISASASRTCRRPRANSGPMSTASRDDEDLGAASFLELAHRRHFYFGIADGVKADFVRFRQCDARLNAQGGRKTASAYDAIGAAQVAKASFSGMRLLHRLDGKVAIWPMDPAARTRQRGGRNLHAHLPAPRRHDRHQAPQPRRAQPRPGRPRQPAGAPCASSPTTTRPTRWSPPPGCAQLAIDRAARLRSRRPDGPKSREAEGWTFGVL